VDLTIEEISRRGLLWTGTRHRTAAEGPLFTESTIRGFPVAWIGCAEATNGIPDRFRQVQSCGGEGVTRLVRRLAQDGRFAAIIVTPHWGAEYQTAASAGQARLAKAWAAAGATLILGNHPHVLQPIQWLDNGRGGKTLVSYSLGNFVAGQAALERRTSAILHVDLARQSDGSLRVSQFSYTPFYRLPPPAQTLRRLETFSQPPAGAAEYVRRVLGAPSCL
jgi:poly-gamma-glutamate synthesis protein (capsule biosynthesis protein)